MNKLEIFTDASVNPKTKVGFGAYLVVDKETLSTETIPIIKLFNNTSSSKLELQTLIWALNETYNTRNEITVYTDSQNIISLLKRRQKLEFYNYISAKGKLLANHTLYKDFFKLYDNLNIKLIKVKGHIKSIRKNDIDKLFTIVDRASRNALRNYYKIN